MSVVLIIAVFGLHFSLPSFFDSDEKELRGLHQTAEAAMTRADYPAAKDAYQEILKRVVPPFSQSKNSLEWTSYVDLLLRLAQVHLKLEEFEEGDVVLTNLLGAHPPSELMSRILLLQARLRCGKEGGQGAYIAMKKVLQHSPQEEWNKEDRSLFQALEYSLNSTYDALLEKARRYFVAGSFAEAAAMYTELLEAIQKGCYPKKSDLLEKKVRCRLAEAHYQSAHFQKTLELIDTEHEAEDQIDRQMLYLAAMAYREEQAYAKALTCFQAYIESADPSELEHYNHAQFEIAYAHYRCGCRSKAKELFETLQTAQGKPGKLAALYLARICLEENDPHRAETILKALDYPAMRHEIAYLKGKAAFSKENFTQAASFFEEAIAISSHGDNWSADVYYHLGLCYLKTQRKLTSAEAIFQKLGDERSHLALAKVYLVDNQRDKTESFLTERLPSLSEEGQVQALLLCAEGASDPLTYLLRATDAKYARAPSYGIAWYTLGLHYFPTSLAHAAGAFEKAFLFFQTKDPFRAAESLKMEAKAALAQNAPFAALALVDRLIDEFSTTSVEKEEALYLKGLVASRIEQDLYFSLATETLLQLALDYPDGEYADNALNVLGSLYYQKEEFARAEEVFLTLAESYPGSEFAGDALFWAAASAEKLGESPLPLHKRVYEQYPQSRHADEAYFRHFSFEEYLRGEPKALAHIKLFATLYPDSPIQVITSYLTGTHEQNVAFAKRSFREAIAAFETLCPKDVAYLFFYYRARLELAQTLLAYGEDASEANALLKTLVGQLRENPQLFKGNNPYPPLQEESEFTLAQSYLKLGKNFLAQETFAHMLSSYARYEISEGYHLARVWMEEAKLSLACDDLETADECLRLTADCGKTSLTAEDRLTLWMLQSDLHRAKKELDEAMRMLSKVINEDVVSPLRLKAMLKRAEIYELQGRHELAIRQLEATAKKGGEWGTHATQKLKERYGLD